jgi:hypothetical protein
MYKIVTHEEAKKYKEYILSGSLASSSPKVIIYNTKSALESKLNQILFNQECFESDTELLKDDFLDIFNDLKIKILKCELLLLGAKSLPVFIHKPKFSKKTQAFKLSDFILRMLKIEAAEEEKMLANTLSQNYPSKTFWSNMFLDEGFKVNSLNWFMSTNGQLFLKQHSDKQSLI